MSRRFGKLGEGAGDGGGGNEVDGRGGEAWVGSKVGQRQKSGLEKIKAYGGMGGKEKNHKKSKSL